MDERVVFTPAERELLTDQMRIRTRRGDHRTRIVVSLTKRIDLIDDRRPYTVMLAVDALERHVRAELLTETLAVVASAMLDGDAKAANRAMEMAIMIENGR